MTAAQAGSAQRSDLLFLFAPYLFVFLWSTGFVGARFGLPYAEPFTFVAMRLGLTVALLIPVVMILRTPWPKDRRQFFNIAVVGVMAHAGYLAGNFYSMSKGMPLGLVALVGALQPLLTAVFAGPFLKEDVTARAWAGLSIGLAGVVLVLWPKLGSEGVTLDSVAGVAIGVVSMTAATLYQKRYCPDAPLRSGAVIQFAAATAVVTPLAFLFETRTVEWSLQLVAAMAWLGIVISIGAITLFWMLVRRGEAAKVASMFYLTPLVTALLAYILFGEQLTWLSILGMVIAVGGVALVTAVRPRPVSTE